MSVVAVLHLRPEALEAGAYVDAMLELASQRSRRARDIAPEEPEGTEYVVMAVPEGEGASIARNLLSIGMPYGWVEAEDGS